MICSLLAYCEDRHTMLIIFLASEVIRFSVKTPYYVSLVINALLSYFCDIELKHIVKHIT